MILYEQNVSKDILKNINNSYRILKHENLIFFWNSIIFLIIPKLRNFHNFRNVDVKEEC
jgi:hypothetical protein